jgi:hypothetical protein
MQYSELIPIFDSSVKSSLQVQANTENLAMYVQIGYSLLIIMMSASIIATICMIEKRSSLAELVVDKKYSDPQESVDTEESPSALHRMCSHGCCPLGQKFEDYYNTFPLSALKERNDSLMQECNMLSDEYTLVKEAYNEAKDNYNRVHKNLAHMIKSSEKLDTVYESRVIAEKVGSHNVDELYDMLSAVHQWKPFEYAPEGLYPHQKTLWETVLLNEIYTRKNSA